MKHTFTFLLLLAAMAMAPMGLQAQSSCDITLPWSENFDSYTTDGGTAFPTCWTRFSPFQLNTTTTRPNFYVFGAGTHGTVLNFNGQANHSSSPSGVMRIATPRIPAQLNHLELSFEVAGDGLMIYAATDTANTSTFVLIGTFSGPSLYAWSSYELHTDTIAGIPSDTGYIVFAAAYGNSGYSTARLDNLAVTAINACERPSSVTVELVGVTTASLSWPDVAAAQGYLVSYDTVNDITNAASVTADNNTVTLTDLEPGTTYYVWVQSNCGNGSYSDARTATLTTQLSCYSITGLTQVSSTFEAASFQWDFDTRGNSPTGVLTVLHDLTDPLIPDVVELSTGTNSHIFTNLDNSHEYSVSFYTLCDGDTANGVDAYIIFRNCGESALFTGANDHSADFPLASAYGTSYSQVLYDADVLYSMDTIRGVALHRFVGSNASPISRTLSLYIGHTSLDSLTSNQGTTGLTRVASGVSYNLAAQEWDTLLFTTPFVYDGHSNVLFVVEDSTGTGVSLSAAAQWYWHSSEGKMYYKYGTSSMTPTYKQPDIRFVGNCNNELLCEPPAVAIGEVDSVSAVVTWVGAAGSDIVVEYRSQGGGSWTVVDTVMSDDYTLQGLNPSTHYEVRLGVICNDSLVRYSTPAPFTTACAIFHIPFDFTQNDMIAAADNGFTDCWNFSQYVRRGRLTDSHRGYLRNVADAQWIMLPAVAESLQNVRLRTWVGTSDDGFFKVGVASQSDCSDVVWIDTVEVPHNNVNTSHEEFISYLDVYTGTGNRVVVSPMVNNDWHYMYFFDFHLEAIEGCRPAVDLTLDDANADSLTFHWTPRGNATSWAVYVDGVQVGTATGTPSFTASGLDPYTDYEVSVRTLCGEGDTSDAVSATFRTGCDGEQCSFTVYGTASSGEGWKGGFMEIKADSTVNVGTVRMLRGSTVSETFNVCADMEVSFKWYSGNADEECSFVIVNAAGDTVYAVASATELPNPFYVTDSLCGGGAVDPQPTQYTVTVNYDATRGTVTGAGTYDEGTVVTLVATPREGYDFDSWDNGQRDSILSFTLTTDVTLTANFVEIVGIGTVDACSLVLSPNPASSTVTLMLNEELRIKNEELIEVLDLKGRRVLTQIIKQSGNQAITIDVSTLPSGTYFVRVANGRTTAIRKLVVR